MQCFVYWILECVSLVVNMNRSDIKMRAQNLWTKSGIYILCRNRQQQYTFLESNKHKNQCRKQAENLLWLTLCCTLFFTFALSLCGSKMYICALNPCFAFLSFPKFWGWHFYASPVHMCWYSWWHIASASAFAIALHTLITLWPLINMWARQIYTHSLLPGITWTELNIY